MSSFLKADLTYSAATSLSAAVNSIDNNCETPCSAMATPKMA